MPNGVSCAYFAGRNFVYGKSEDNVFKEGIGCVQTVRTADAIAQSSLLNNSKMTVNSSLKTGIGKGATFGKKIVYPLIIASGLYNTIMSDDKVKAGAMNAGGIGVMYGFEQAAEKILDILDEKILNSNFSTKNKYVKYVWYALKGMSFAAASLLGYDIGSKSAEKVVDSSRTKKTPKVEAKESIFDQIAS